MSKISAIVLAAGTSSRFGAANKLLVPVASGEPMVRAVVQNAIACAALDPVIVVTGHEHDSVEAALSGLGIEIVCNKDFASGQSTSLKCGLANVPEASQGAMVLLGDMPDVSSAVMGQIADAFSSPDDIIVPYADGKRGNPVIIGRDHFLAVAGLEGDTGARALLSGPGVRQIELEDTGILSDYDTPGALAGKQ